MYVHVSFLSDDSTGLNQLFIDRADFQWIVLNFSRIVICIRHSGLWLFEIGRRIPHLTLFEEDQHLPVPTIIIFWLTFKSGCEING